MGDRFSAQMEDYTADYNESLSFDHVLYHYSIEASRAHAQMLAETGILTEEDCRKILDGLDTVEGKLDRSEIQFGMLDEDIMMTIEKHLILEIGMRGSGCIRPEAATIRMWWMRPCSSGMRWKTASGIEIATAVQEQRMCSGRSRMVGNC